MNLAVDAKVTRDTEKSHRFNVWVFVDEPPDSINDGWLTDSWPGGGGWGDMAGSPHAAACGIGFADGHAEIHKWKDKGTLQPATKAG